MNSPTPDVIEKLLPHQVFVFGSNEAGRHGRGAAKTAMQWGAQYQIGYGHVGQTFAIPTKNASIQTLDLNSIAKYVDWFVMYVINHPELEFFVTRIGCGLAGYKPEQIAPMFMACLDMKNVHLPQDFISILQKH
jgi:hypothetical protein